MVTRLKFKAKVLFFLGAANPFPGAAWTRIGFFADAWSKKGHLVEVLGAFSYRSLQKRGVRNYGKVNIFNLIFNMSLNHPAIFTVNSIISFIISILFLAARKPDVVIVSVPSGDVGLGAIMACKLVRAKCVVDYRDEWEDYTINLTNSRIGVSFYSAVKKLMNGLYAKCLFTVGVTPNFVMSLKRRGIVNVRFVPNGADVNVFRPYDKRSVRKRMGFAESDFLIVYCGMIGEYYKLDFIIRALAKLHGLEKVIKLLIMGQGPDLPFILRLSKILGLSNNVLYLGVKNDKNEIAEILSSGDIGVIPGLYTKGQLPVKFFEYCACGLPVIATVREDSLLAQIIHEYGVGLVVPSMNLSDLANAFKQLYQDGEAKREYGRRGRILVEEMFDRNKIAEEFLKMVEEVVNQQSSNSK